MAAQEPIDATGEAFYDALSAISAALPAAHPAIRHLADALGSAGFAEYTPVAANAGYALIEPDGTLTIYAAADLATLQTYVAALT